MTDILYIIPSLYVHQLTDAARKQRPKSIHVYLTSNMYSIG